MSLHVELEFLSFSATTATATIWQWPRCEGFGGARGSPAGGSPRFADVVGIHACSQSWVGSALELGARKYATIRHKYLKRHHTLDAGHTLEKVTGDRVSRLSRSL